jgi:hypothetical protein
MQVLLDFLALVGIVLFVMVLVLVLWDLVVLMFFEALWYIAMAVVFYMLVGAALNMLRAISRLFKLGRYKRC